MIKPQYVEAACQIEGYNSFGESIKNGKLIALNESENNRRSGFERLRKAGVLELWFEPVYKEIIPTVINDDDKEFLTWMYNRITEIHGENEYYDYMIRFKKLLNENN